MTELTLAHMLDDIYAAFGRRRPSHGEPAWNSIAKRTADVPDAAEGFIVSVVSDYDALPSNLGKAISAAYLRWLENNPMRCDEINQTCGHCHNGWRIFVSAKQPFGSYIRCLCMGGDARTLQDMQQLGGIEVPCDFQGTPQDYALSLGLWMTSKASRNDEHVQEIMRSISHSVGREPERNPQRTRRLTEQEILDRENPF